MGLSSEHITASSTTNLMTAPYSLGLNFLQASPVKLECAALLQRLFSATPGIENTGRRRGQYLPLRQRRHGLCTTLSFVQASYQGKYLQMCTQ